MSAAKRYVVTDEDGNISWSAKTEASETFKGFAAAEKRAHEMAKFAPGQTISIYGLEGEVIAPVSEPVTKAIA